MDYKTYEINDNRYLCISLLIRKTLLDLQDDLNKVDLRVIAVVPLISFGIRYYGLKHIIDNGPGFPLQLPDIRFSLELTESSYILGSAPIKNPEESDHYSSNFHLKASNDQIEEGLYFQKTAGDIISRIYSLSIGWMKPVIVGVISFLAIMVLFNLIITAFEIKGSEKLDEYQFLQANLESIYKQIENIEQKQNLVYKLETHRRDLASYLTAVAYEKPEKLWWRKLKYEIEGGLTLEGFCVGEEGTATYYKKLAESHYFYGLELSKMEKYTIRENSRIPSKYHDQIYKFRLDIRGI